MGIFNGIKKMFTDEDLEKIKDGENKNVNQLISEIKKTNTTVKNIDYNHFTTRVNIVDNGEDILTKISPGHEFELKRDKNNSVDPYAVAIFYAGTYIGVLKKEVAKFVATNIDKGINYLCVVTNVIGSGSFNYIIDIKLDAYDIHVMCLNCGRDVVIADEGTWNCSYCGAKLPQGKIGMTEPQRPRNNNPSMNSQINYNRSVNYNNQNSMNQRTVNYNMNSQNMNYNNMTQSTINYNNNMNYNNSMNYNNNMNYNNMTQSSMNNQNMSYNGNQNSMNYQQSVNYNRNQNSSMNQQNYNRNYNDMNTQSVNYNRNQNMMNQSNMSYNRNQNMNYNRNQNDMNSTMSVNYRNRRKNEYEQDNYIEKIYNNKKEVYEDDFLNYIPEKEDDDEIVRLDPFNNGNDYF